MIQRIRLLSTFAFALATTSLAACMPDEVDEVGSSVDYASNDQLEAAGRAIRSKLAGCDPNGPCDGGSAGWAAEIQRRVGRPTTWNPNAPYCPGRMVLDTCRRLLDEPEVIRGASPPGAPELPVYFATFEHGQIYAYPSDQGWQVYEIVDDFGAAFASLYAGVLAPAGSGSFLGVPASGFEADRAGRPEVRFRDGACEQRVTLHADRNVFAVEALDDCAPAQVLPVPALSARLAWLVNGHRLGRTEEQGVRFYASQVVPYLSGTRQERLTKAARVAWWALKEGVLDVRNPVAYSLCHFASGDASIGAFEVCPGAIWQSGIAGKQVWDAPAQATLEAWITERGPGSIDEELRRAATFAGLGGGDANRVAAATSGLRRAWLVRVPYVGVEAQVGTVVGECVDGSRSWCYGRGWDTSALYAPTRAGAFRAMDDLYGLLDALSP